MTTTTTGDGPGQVDESVVLAAAERLAAAAASRTPCAPVRDLIGPDDVATAYRIQERFNALNTGSGLTVIGRKIGATSQAVQQQLGVDQPDFGVLFSDMIFHDGDVLPSDRLLQPKAEAEVAFVLSADLDEGSLDVEQCRSAVGQAVAAIEIVDSRITNWDISFADTVADNASSGLFVLGKQYLTLDEVEPVDVTMSMDINGEEVSTGSGADCLGDPLIALSWLARRAREFGEPLRAGQIILSGALGPMRPLNPGDVVSVNITGLGTVSASYSTDLEVN